VCPKCALLLVDTHKKHEKTKKTNLQKYGVEYVSKLDTCKQKMQKTVQEKYGVRHIQQLSEVKEKAKQTNLEKYGAEYPQQNKKVRAKTKQTNLQKYGVEYVSQSEETKNKVKQTFLERYGFDNPNKSVVFREKTKQTVLKKYGVEHISQLKASQDKVKETVFNKYGVEYASQSSEIKEKIKKTIFNKYGTEYYFQSEDFKEKSNANQWFTSKAELEIKAYIESFGLTTTKKRPDHQELDIVIEDKKIAIEYNGLYWHSEARRNYMYHFEKTQTANKHGYRLIHVFEHEWRDRKDQVKSYLRSALGMNTVKIFARKCELVITQKDKQVLDFIDKHHIQGKAKSILEVSLYHENQLVAVASFGRHHRDVGKIVLNRFVCLSGTTISGGLSRISKAASLYFKQDIISWCDLRWSEGNGYLKAGWEQEDILKPDYFYTDRYKYISKQSRKKSNVNTPLGLTEHEHALQDGLFRVYDCGKIRFIYRY
jgi:G:T-mismatch repair DNA endonuclease (very short patch repair protein)